MKQRNIYCLLLLTVFLFACKESATEKTNGEVFSDQTPSETQSSEKHLSKGVELFNKMFLAVRKPLKLFETKQEKGKKYDKKPVPKQSDLSVKGLKGLSTELKDVLYLRLRWYKGKLFKDKMFRAKFFLTPSAQKEEGNYLILLLNKEEKVLFQKRIDINLEVTACPLNEWFDPATGKQIYFPPPAPKQQEMEYHFFIIPYEPEAIWMKILDLANRQVALEMALQ